MQADQTLRSRPLFAVQRILHTGCCNTVQDRQTDGKTDRQLDKKTETTKPVVKKMTLNTPFGCKRQLTRLRVVVGGPAGGVGHHYAPAVVVGPP